MTIPEKSKWTGRWTERDVRQITEIAKSMPRQQNQSDLSRWRAAECLYRTDFARLSGRSLKA